MPLVPPVRQHMVANQQPGDDGVQIELFVRIVILQFFQPGEKVPGLPVRQGFHPGMEQASEDHQVCGKEGPLLPGQGTGQPGLQGRDMGRFVVPVHDLTGRSREMDASQGPQIFGEIPAGGTVVQGQ